MPPDSQPQFRVAIPADAELLLDFMKDYYAFDGHHYDREKARDTLLGLLKNSAYGIAWLILNGSVAVGYIVLCFGYSLEFLGRDAFIDEFYLIEEYRGRGWGRRTFEFVQEEARRQNVRAIHLEVVRKNASALEFYRRLGFKDHDHRLMTIGVAQGT